MLHNNIYLCIIKTYFYFKVVIQHILWMYEKYRMVEVLSKKEFYTLYTSPALKREVKGSAVCLHVCAGFTFLFHLFAAPLGFSSSGIPWLDLLLMVGCGLGLQLGQSRACAVGVTVYSVFNTLFWLLDTGKFGGWWIIAIGVASIRTTFALHKEYVRYLRDGKLPRESIPIVSRPSSALDGAQQEPVIVVRETTPVYTPRAYLATATPFILLFPCLLLSLLVISDTVLEWLVGEEPGALALLLGYHKQYILCIVLLVVSVVMAVAGSVISIRWGIKSQGANKLIAVCVVCILVIPTVMILLEDIPSLIVQAQEDIDQIHSGSTEEAVVWFSPQARSAYLPGPSGAELVTRYVGIGDDTGGRWEHFYVPNSLGFSMNEDALYNENRSIQWNEEHASRYRVEYTTNFCLVVSVEEIP